MEEIYIIPSSPEHLYSVFVDPTVHESVTKAKASIDGQSFSYYDGKFSGFIDEKNTNRTLRMRWRHNTWKEGLYSNVCLTFKPTDDLSTKIILRQTDIPSGVSQEEVANLWEEHYWDILKPKLTR
jgi:activator of HSP90 ATPase